MNKTPLSPRLLAAVCAGSLAIALAARLLPASGAIEPGRTGLCDPALASPAGTGPLRAIHAHVCGFHFYSGDLKRALRADHYCSHLDPDVFQCIIYESDARNARLIGIEYIISEALFRQLPAAEKKLWHSHRYEVMSGQLVAPELDAAAERALMQEFVTTYGKTWYLWQVDRGDALPVGLPKLMMGFTADGQADPAMVAERDREFGIDSAAVRAGRTDLPVRPVATEADAWQHEVPFQIDDRLLQQTPTAPIP